MDRSSWSALSKDPELWKKIALGAGSLLLFIPIPVAMGIVNLDLENEVQRKASKEPPGDGALPSVDDLAKVVMSGIGPSMLFLAAAVLFAIPAIPTGLALLQMYAFLRPGSELSIPFMSLLVSLVIGLVGLAGQVLAAASFPVALAQYARGKDLRPALAVLPNAVTVVEMGMPYWIKVSGVVFGMLSMTVLSIIGLVWYLNLPVCLAIFAIFFVSLTLSSRFALAHITAELPSSALPPLPTPDAD
jgi:hypothetical protein